MAQAKQPFDWDNKINLRRRAWESVKEFFGKEEPEHAMSPETVAEQTKGNGNDRRRLEDPNAERIHRPTERRNISDSPSTTWPG